MADSSRRQSRELRTIAAMIRIYCRGNHDTTDLCDDCRALLDYATTRVERCPFAPDKPVCSSCPVHCYAALWRDRIRAVMRYAGPRMLWRHPILALLHLLDGWRARPKRQE